MPRRDVDDAITVTVLRDQTDHGIRVHSCYRADTEQGPRRSGIFIGAFPKVRRRGAIYPQALQYTCEYSVATSPVCTVSNIQKMRSEEASITAIGGSFFARLYRVSKQALKSNKLIMKPCFVHFSKRRARCVMWPSGTISSPRLVLPRLCGVQLLFGRSHGICQSHPTAKSAAWVKHAAAALLHGESVWVQCR
jgi:hypothetical protein